MPVLQEHFQLKNIFSSFYHRKEFMTDFKSSHKLQDWNLVIKKAISPQAYYDSLQMLIEHLTIITTSPEDIRSKTLSKFFYTI